MKIHASKLNTRLAAKIITYNLNAYVDNQIAVELKTFFESGKMTGAVTVPKLRAQQLVSRKSQLTNSYLVGLMYTQRQINGLINHTYAHRLTRMIIGPHAQEIKAAIAAAAETFLSELSPKTVENPYAHEPFRLFAAWWTVVMDNPNPLHQYAKNFLNYDRSIKPLEVARACAAVQIHNSAHNLLTAKQLISKNPSSDLKINTLQHLATAWPYPKEFIASAAETLRAAAAWDRRLLFLLRLKHPISRKI